MDTNMSATKEEKVNADLEKSLRNIELSKGSICDVMEGDLVYGDVCLKVNLIRFKESQNDDFLISSIYDQFNKTIWNFREENFKGRGLLVPHKEIEEHIIVLEKWGKVHKIIPVTDLLRRKAVTGPGGKIFFVGGKSTKEIIAIKRYVAKYLNMELVFSKEEQTFICAQESLERKKVAEAMELKKQQEQERYLAEERIRQEKIKTILARPEIRAISPDGKKLRGIWVKEGEWQMLSFRIPVILVEIDESGTMKVLEAFFAEKTISGRPKKGSPKIALPEVKEQKESIANVEKIFFFEIEGELVEALSCSAENFINIKKSGLNGNTLFAVGSPDKENKYKVVRMEKDNKHYEVGSFVLKATIDLL